MVCVIVCKDIIYYLKNLNPLNRFNLNSAEREEVLIADVVGQVSHGSQGVALEFAITLLLQVPFLHLFYFIVYGTRWRN